MYILYQDIFLSYVNIHMHTYVFFCLNHFCGLDLDNRYCKTTHWLRWVVEGCLKEIVFRCLLALFLNSPTLGVFTANMTVNNQTIGQWQSLQTTPDSLNVPFVFPLFGYGFHPQSGWRRLAEGGAHSDHHPRSLWGDQMVIHDWDGNWGIMVSPWLWTPKNAFNDGLHLTHFSSRWF